ncbi:MAG: hypothetical protein AAF383_20815 [Cyanobacteria bacterium P01_A01_bin.83]
MNNEYRYQHQDSNQTLQQGLEEYYASIPGLTIVEDVEDQEIAKMLTLHDVTHVIFGCNTTIEGEFLCDTWAMVASNVSFSKYLEYLKDPETQQIFQEIGYLQVIWMGIKSLPKIIKVYLNSRKMTKKWGWEDYREYLNRPLKDIRQEFNICLV